MGEMRLGGGRGETMRLRAAGTVFKRNLAD